MSDVTLAAPVLEGDHVRLEPLDHRHVADLAVAAEEDRSSYVFSWVPTAAEVGEYIDAQLARAAAGKLAPYAQVAKASGRAVGTTAYWDPRPWPDGGGLCAVEVGFNSRNIPVARGGSQLPGTTICGAQSRTAVPAVRTRRRVGSHGWSG